MRFEEWKAKSSVVIARLISNSTNHDMTLQLRNLLDKLEYARSIDVARIVRDLVRIADYWKIKELYQIIPKPEDIDEWYAREG